MSLFEQWNARFASNDYVFGTSPAVFLREQVFCLPPKARVLAVADGEGRNGVWLAEHGCVVTSVDISSKGQDKAARLAAARGVDIDLRIADLADWAWPVEHYDAVIAIFIQFAAPALRDDIFANICRATRPGGRVLLQGYRPEQLDYATGGPSSAENMYTAPILRTAFTDWDIEHLVEHDSVLDEGIGHSGMSALIDMVARKPL